MKYQNNILNKFAKIQNNSINNVKITYKTNNYIFKHINNKTKMFTKITLLLKMLLSINLNVTVIHFIWTKQLEILK
jgi:hypothetical protein